MMRIIIILQWKLRAAGKTWLQEKCTLETRHSQHFGVNKNEHHVRRCLLSRNREGQEDEGS